jgi:hypothetical protein
MDELTELVFGFLEGRYALGAVAFGECAMIELDKVLVDCTPNEEGKDSRFDCLGEFIPDTFLDELARLVIANFEVDVSVVDGPKAALLLKTTQPGR